MPTLTFICGPNGAGKSTFSRVLAMKRNMLVIDPDNLASQGLTPMVAGKTAIKLARQLIQDGVSFGRESTLSSHFDFRLMREAREHGYKIELIFIALDSPALAIERVQARKAVGGHDVPVDDIIRRFYRSLENLPKALALADEYVILNNSGGNYRRQ